MFENGLPERFTEPKRWLWGEFKNARGGTLRFGNLNIRKTPLRRKPLAHIVYVEGLSEHSEKTFEIARSFNKISCNFSVIDRFGQGQSTHYLKDAPHKQHSDDIKHDADDLIQYCKAYIPKDEPIVLLGHSTGGLITLATVEKGQELFKAAILTSPLLGFEDSRLKDKEKFYAIITLPQIIHELYVPGGEQWQSRDDPANLLETDDLSRHPQRNAISDYWAKKNKILQTGDPTIGWTIEMCRAITTVREPSFLSNIKIPILIFTAGQDMLINNDHTFEAIKHLPNAEHHHYKLAKHDILMETDDIRDDFLSKSRIFLKNNL